MIAVPRQRKPE